MPDQTYILDTVDRPDCNRPRCHTCDAPFRNQSDLIAHQLEHRGTAEELASGLEKAADAGLRAQAGVAQKAGHDA